MSNWEEEWERECRLNDIKARKAWKEKYSKLKPIEKTIYTKKHKVLTFLDSVVEKENAVETRTTRLTWGEDGLMRVWSGVSKSQRFLCVNGPLAGQKIEDDNEDYVLYNRNGRYGKEVPKCVLVHKDAFK